MKKISFLFVVAMLYMLAPVWAQAAFNDVTTEDGTTSIVLDDSTSYVIDLANRVESFTVNASTIDFNVLPGSVISITSNDRKNFTYSSTSCETIEKTCNSSLSQLFIRCSNQSVSHTVTVSPSGTCTASSGGGSSGGGGSGSSSPIKTTPEPEKVIVKPVVTTKPVIIDPISTLQIPVTPVKAPLFIFKKQLKIGSNSKDVKELQIKLKSLGYFPKTITPNGNFGPATTKAVKAFQKANKIAQVGNVGPLTLKALNK